MHVPATSTSTLAAIFFFFNFFYEAVALTACSSQIERQPLTPNKLQ